ncbi:transposon Tf2-9 polyprotein [Trichonephila clavipes]|nr:transposon Tf2-9 polyprotein [Trichonephila clavipes]
MMEGCVLILYTDHKPLTFAFNPKLDKANPRQLRHLDFISQFTTNIRYVPGIDNVPADAFSRISAIMTPSTIDYEEFAQIQVRAYVPHALRRNVFLVVHDLSHPEIRATTKLISKSFVWTSMKKDIHSWTRSCIPCQRVKIQRHTNSELGHFKVPDARFHHLHLDIIGPLPPSQGPSYCRTVIDRFSRWSEAYAISDMTA